MAEAHWVRHSLRLGVVGVHRRLRGVRRDRARLRLLGLTFVLFVITVGGLGALFAYGLRDFATPITVPGSLRIGVTLAWLFVVWRFFQQVLVYYRDLDTASFVLTTVSARTTVVSLLITDVLTACIVLLLPTVTLVGVIGYAFVQWESVVLIPLATVLFAASAAVAGYVAGFVSLHRSMRSGSVTQTNGSGITQLVVRLLVILLVVAVVTNGAIPRIGSPAVGGFEWLPTSWFIDLAALGTPATATVIRASIGLFGTLGVIVGGSAVVEHLATAYWYGASSAADAPETTTSDANDSAAITSGTDVLAAALSPLFVPDVVSTPTRRVAQVVLLRLRRTPRRLSFLVGPAVSFVVVLLVQTPNPSGLIPPVCAIAIPWLAGATFGLNPLGDEGAVLPATLTSVAGREFVRGLMVPGMLYGLPLTVVCTLIAGVFGPYSAVELVGLVVVGAILAVVATVVAPAIGMRFPRFDAIVVGQRSGVVLPSLVALAIYTALVSILGRLATLTVTGPAVVARFLPSYSPSVEAVRLGGTVSILVIAALIGLVSYRSAVSRFTTYVVE